MTALVRAELKKILSTRLWWGLLIGALAFSAVQALATAAFSGVEAGAGQPSMPGLESAEAVRSVYAMSMFTGTYMFAMVLGITGMTGEYRYQTITATFLATPRRGRVVAAKMAAHLLVGAGYAVAALLVALVAGRAALPWACRRGVGAARPDGLGATVAGTVRPVAALASTVVSFALVAAIAVLAGSDVRDTTPMLVAGVAGIAVALAAVTHAVRRLGGITGDVLGFGVELATTATLALAAVLVG